MTRQLVFGLLLATAVASAGIWPFKKDKAAKSGAPQTAAKSNQDAGKAKDSQGFESLYTDGTVAIIPQLTNGKLDLTDRNTLSFHFGKPTWSIPYNKITSIEVYDKNPSELFRVPYLQKKKRVFTLNFDSDRGKQRAEFEMGLEAAASVLPLLEERSGRYAFVEGQKDAEAAWTDRYWKTANNSAKWDEAANGNQKSKTMSAAKDE